MELLELLCCDCCKRLRFSCATVLPRCHAATINSLREGEGIVRSLLSVFSVGWWVDHPSIHPSMCCCCIDMCARRERSSLNLNIFHVHGIKKKKKKKRAAYLNTHKHTQTTRGTVAHRTAPNGYNGNTSRCCCCCVDCCVDCWSPAERRNSQSAKREARESWSHNHTSFVRKAGRKAGSRNYKHTLHIECMAACSIPTPPPLLLHF